MTNLERKHLCQLLASLFSPPDQEMIKQVHDGAVYAFFKKYVGGWKEDVRILTGFIPSGDFHSFLVDLKNEYDRLFSNLLGSGVSLVESYYKPWTMDPTCSLPFASSKGFLMGDSAVHLLEVYRQCHMEVAEEFKAFPDHLVLELEFLSHLYQWATGKEIMVFIKDHLDWIPLIKNEAAKNQIHPFYLSLLEVLDLFLKKERERLEVK